MSLEKLRTARTVAGIHQVCKAVLSGEAETVFIAADVGIRILRGSLSCSYRPHTWRELGEQ